MAHSFLSPLKMPLLAIPLAAALCVSLSLPVALAPPAAAQQTNADLNRVARHMRSISTLTADFSQTDRAGTVLRGRLSLKQPGRIRFEYQQDVPLLIVADGRSLTMIDYEVDQVQRWPIRNSPLGALLDPERDLTRYGRLVPTSSSDVISVEVRDPDRPEYGVITLVFTRNAGSPEGVQLVGWVALDSQNQRTTIRLSNQRYNVPVADSVFRWRDPR